MDHQTGKYWGTLLLRMAADARQEGDLVTAELLAAYAKDCLDEADRLASPRLRAPQVDPKGRWRQLKGRCP
jgi:hypothetical protein